MRNRTAAKYRGVEQNRRQQRQRRVFIFVMGVANAFSAGGFEITNQHLDHLARSVRETAKCGVWWDGVVEEFRDVEGSAIFVHARPLQILYGALAATSSGLEFS